MNEKKIFVTVGTQLPFTRIFDYVHEWSKSTEIPHRIYAQIAETDIKHPFHETRKYLSSDEFNAWFSEADCIVAHAGMGTIINSSIFAKPLIIVPRQEKLGEHRNNHQLDTALKFKGLSNVKLANSESEFCTCLNDFCSFGGFQCDSSSDSISGELGEKINDWIKKTI